MTTVNPRIDEINKELEEWNVKLNYVNNEIDEFNKLIADLETKAKSEDTIISKEAQGSLWFQKPRLEGSKQKKQMVESEIAKLQDELKTLQP